MAPLYIYRNLRTGGFSVRHKGRVIDRIEHAVAFDVQLKVNQGGRSRVLLEKQKNVHAFVVARGICRETDRLSANLKEITYNPYQSDSFMCNGQPIYRASIVLFENGRCYRIAR